MSMGDSWRFVIPGYSFLRKRAGPLHPFEGWQVIWLGDQGNRELWVVQSGVLQVFSYFGQLRMRCSREFRLNGAREGAIALNRDDGDKTLPVFSSVAVARDA